MKEYLIWFHPYLIKEFFQYMKIVFILSPSKTFKMGASVSINARIRIFLLIQSSLHRFSS